MLFGEKVGKKEEGECGGKPCVSGSQVIERMKTHYVSYGEDLKDRMVSIFGNLTNATA